MAGEDKESSLAPIGEAEDGRWASLRKFRWPKEIVKAKVHPRLMSDATTTMRFGKDYPGGGKAEFQVQTKLYAVDPVHVAKPFNLVTDSKGEVIGYEMERIDGQTLNEYMETHPTVPEDISRQIRETVAAFHNSGLVHGDLNGNNVLIDSEGTVKLVDPVGYGDLDPEEFLKFVLFDQRKLKENLR